jgi:hypothetical protein
MNDRILPNIARVIPSESSNGSYSSLFQRCAPVIERCFLPFLGGEDVVFHAPNGTTYAPVSDDQRIWIILWSTPRERDRFQLLGLNTILGHPTQNQTKVFPSIAGVGQKIEAEPRGPAVAQVLGRRIYILASISDEPKPILEMILETILNRALEIFLNESIVYPGSLYGQVQQDPEEDIISALLFPREARVQALEQTIENFRSEACAIERGLANLGHDIRRAAHDVSLEEQLLSACKNDTPSPDLGRNLITESVRLREKAREEFEFIITHPLMRYLPHSSDTTLTAYTRHIFTRHRANGTLHDMGFYRMIVPINKATDFRWFNLTRRKKGTFDDMNHPHIYADGHACLGNAKDTLDRAMEVGDLYGTILLGFRFLTSCNINDTAGKSLPNWPSVDETKNGK